MVDRSAIEFLTPDANKAVKKYEDNDKYVVPELPEPQRKILMKIPEKIRIIRALKNKQRPRGRHTKPIYIPSHISSFNEWISSWSDQGDELAHSELMTQYLGSQALALINK